MKKTKILTVLAVLLAMGMTACGKKTSSSVVPSSEEPPVVSSSEEPASSSSVHEHSWDQGTVTTQPTCTEKGVKTYRCSGCNETKTEEVPALGHDWQEGTVTTQPTCTQKGIKTITCSRCTETKTEDVAALGHDYGEWTVTKEANCHEEGLKERFCKRDGCDAKESDIIAKTAHDWSEWKVTKEASCVAGSKERVCSICGDKETEAIPINPDIDHNWGEWQVVKPASCAKGQEKRVCKNCEIEDFREIPALEGAEHNWGTPVVTEPTYDPEDNTKIVKAGYSTSTCANCGGIRLEIDAAQAVLEPILKKDGTQLVKDDKVVMSKLKTEEVADPDDGTAPKIKVGTKLDKYDGMPSGSWSNPQNVEHNDDDYAYQGAFSFKFDVDKAADVVVYQYGCMDSFSGNKDRTYYSGADETNFTYGNFAFDVNGEEIDLYGQRKVKWSDILSERNTEDTTDKLRNSGYSTFGEFLIGEAQLVKGENTFVYKRLASYNLILDKIILEVTYPDHAHEAAENAEWVNNNEDFHWKNCKEGDGHKLEKARHTFGDPYLVTLETCNSKGLARKACKVCGYTVDIERNQLSHDLSVKLAENAAGEGYMATETLGCANDCGETALKWDATGYDATKTAARSDEGNGPSLQDSNKAVKFGSTVQYSGKDTSKKGTHIVYNINVPSAVENAGLSIYMSKGSSSDVFDRYDSDSAKGYEYVGGTEEENLVRPESRYGLKVDGTVVLLNKNNGAVQWVSSGNAWYAMPVTLSLTQGIHEIEIYNLGGYRTNIYSFALTGIPASGESTHTHTLGEWVTTDNNNHWKACTDTECPAGAEQKFLVGAHEWVADETEQDTDPTCTAVGKHYKKCMICGKKASDDIAALGHDYGDLIVDTDSTCSDIGSGHKVCKRCNSPSDPIDIPTKEHNYAPTGEVIVDGTKASQVYTCSICSGTKTISGAVYGTFLWTDALQAGSASLDGDGKVNKGKYNLIVFNVPAAGTYTITLPMKPGSDGTKQLGGSGQGFAVSANGVAGTFLGQGQTYADFFGDGSDWANVAFGEVVLAEGYNEITIEALNTNYRTKINAAGNVTVAPKA